MCFNSDLTPVVELTIQKPAGEAVAETEAETEAEAEGDAEKRLRLVKMTIDHVNNVVDPTLVDLQAKDIVEYDEVLKSVSSAQTISISLALAETGTCMKDEPLYIFVSKTVEHFKNKFETALDGVHHV